MPSPSVATRARLLLVAGLGTAVAALLVAGLRHQASVVWLVVAQSVVASGFVLGYAVRFDAQRRAAGDAHRVLTHVDEATDAAVVAGSVDNLLAEVLHRVRTVVGVDAAAVYLADEHGDLVPYAGEGLDAAALKPVPAGTGLVGTAAAKVRTMVDRGRHDGLALAAATPLVLGGAVTGVLAVALVRPHDLTATDLAMIELFADRAARAVERVQLAETRRRSVLGAEHARRHLRLLADASRIVISSGDDYESALRALIDLAARDFAAYGAVYLADSTGGLRVVTARYVDPDTVETTTPAEPHSLGPIRSAMTTGRSDLVTDVRTEPDAAYRAAMQGLGLTSYVVVPIRIRGLAFGALTLGTAGAQRGFRLSDLRAVEELASRAAVAVEHALLYREAMTSAEQSARNARRTRSLLDAWLSIAAATEGGDGLGVAAEWARSTLEARQAYLLLDGAAEPLAAPGNRSELAAPDASMWTYLRTLDRCTRGGDDARAAWIASPVRPGRGATGGVLLVRGRTGGGFDDDDESLFVLLTQMIATTLTDDHLHETTRSSEARLAGLIHASPVAIVDLDADGDVRAWNPAAARTFGWPEDASAPVALAPVVAERVAALSVEAWAAGGPVYDECLVSRGDRPAQSLEISVALIDETTESGYLLTAIDDTERRQLAAQFQQAQRLEAVGRLAGGIAHDFNNLLTVILGYTDAMLRRMDQDDPTRDRVAAIHKAGSRAATLTRQLLTISRRQMLMPVVVRPAEVVEELAPVVTRMVGDAVRLHVDCDDGAVFLDRSQLDQVLLNLASNARDAMPGGGDLYVESRRQGDHVRLVVRDTGTGMDEATLAQCMEPFFTTKSRDAGTGLGLAAVYGIVAQSGGELALRSTPGAGTVVTMTFPAAAADVPEADLPAPRSVGDRDTVYVLLVEDEADVRTLVRRLLEERGYTVLHAPSGRRALTLLERYRGPVDLVVTDVVMPGMSGIELARQIWAEREDVPVLFVSGYAEDLRAADLGDRPGQARFLAKPFTPGQLVDTAMDMVSPPGQVTARSGTRLPARS